MSATRYKIFLLMAAMRLVIGAPQNDHAANSLALDRVWEDETGG